MLRKVNDMTEVERILRTRPELTEDYLREEVRCGFRVTTERKKIWIILLDLLLELDRVCRKHHLQYSLTYGSLLGAVRHGGFIPWDDDFDVNMPREDYEKLMSLKGEFAAPYFLQCPGEDHGYYYSFLKLRNSNTTSYTPLFAYQGFNMGMMLDIFPLDAWEFEAGKEVYRQIDAINKDNSCFMRRSHPALDEQQRKRAEAWSGRDPRENLRELTRLATGWRGQKTGWLSNGVSTADSYLKNVYPAEIFRGYRRVPFEMLSLPIPEGFDAYLAILYGCYRVFPPAEERGNWHLEFGVDTDTPYRESLIRDGILKE